LTPSGPIDLTAVDSIAWCRGKLPVTRARGRNDKRLRARSEDFTVGFNDAGAVRELSLEVPTAGTEIQCSR